MLPGWRHRGRPAAGWRGQWWAWPAVAPPPPPAAWISSSASSSGHQGPCSQLHPPRGRSGWAGSHWVWPRRRRQASAGHWTAGRREAGERPPHRPWQWPVSPPTGLLLKEQNTFDHSGSHLNNTTTMIINSQQKPQHHLQNKGVFQVVKTNCLNIRIWPKKLRHSCEWVPNSWK